jgi:hypothetical protein
LTPRRFFSEGDLLNALTDVGSHLIEDVRVYLIGGCAMTFIGRKAATKDVDVVLTSSSLQSMSTWNPASTSFDPI